MEVPIDQFWNVDDIVPEHRVARVLLRGRVIYETSRRSLLLLPVKSVERLDEDGLSERE